MQLVSLCRLTGFTVPARHVVHPFWSFSMTQEADYQVFVQRFVVVAPFGIICYVFGCGCCTASDPLSILVTAFASLGDIWTKGTLSFSTSLVCRLQQSRLCAIELLFPCMFGSYASCVCYSPSEQTLRLNQSHMRNVENCRC